MLVPYRVCHPLIFYFYFYLIIIFQYSSSEAPPNHYHLPLTHSQRLSSQSHTVPTPHGPYPIYHSASRANTQIHFSTRPLFSAPLISLAAKLLYFSRREVVKFPIPPHLARDRAEAHARGNFDVGPTMEDVHEANWGWTARLPGGAGTLPAWSWDVHDPAPPPLAAPPADPPHRWTGKAPHTAFGPNADRSRRWDMDWWRLRLCGNAARKRPRIPYGRVYEPGCMDGLWQGRMLVSPHPPSLSSLPANRLVSTRRPPRPRSRTCWAPRSSRRSTSSPRAPSAS